MSTSHHDERLEDILDEVIEAFPYYTRRKQIEIAKKRFEEELIWNLNMTNGSIHSTVL